MRWPGSSAPPLGIVLVTGWTSGLGRGPTPILTACRWAQEGGVLQKCARSDLSRLRRGVNFRERDSDCDRQRKNLPAITFFPFLFPVLFPFRVPSKRGPCAAPRRRSSSGSPAGSWPTASRAAGWLESQEEEELELLLSRRHLAPSLRRRLRRHHRRRSRRRRCSSRHLHRLASALLPRVVSASPVPR